MDTEDEIRDLKSKVDKLENLVLFLAKRADFSEDSWRDLYDANDIDYSTFWHIRDFKFDR